MQVLNSTRFTLPCHVTSLCIRRAMMLDSISKRTKSPSVVATTNFSKQDSTVSMYFMFAAVMAALRKHISLKVCGISQELLLALVVLALPFSFDDEVDSPSCFFPPNDILPQNPED